MSNETYLEFLDYDRTITCNSVFPEWIMTDKLTFERLSEDSIQPRELQNIRKKNSEFYKYFPSADEEKYKSNLNAVIEWYDYADELWKNRTDAFYVIRDYSRNFIGMSYFEEIELDKSRGKLGIWIDQDYRGRGYSQHRAEAFLQIAFNHLQLNLIDVEVVPENTASVNSVKKYMKEFGGSFDGHRRQITELANGSVKDLYIWSISESEFTNQNSTYTQVKSP